MGNDNTLTEYDLLIRKDRWTEADRQRMREIGGFWIGSWLADQRERFPDWGKSSKDQIPVLEDALNAIRKEFGARR